MCDYSLHHVATRPAKIEDKLVATKFNNSITRGFAAVGEPHVAGCPLPRTELPLHGQVGCESLPGISNLLSQENRQPRARLPPNHNDKRAGPYQSAGNAQW